MTIIDELIVPAPPRVCFSVGADVEGWPRILPHYRFVRFREKRAFGTGTVEMSAWRDFAGPFRYPTWWLSEMWLEPDEPAVCYTHIEGVTRGMSVRWTFDAVPAGTHVKIAHAWRGPDWPLIGAAAWHHVIAPHFVSFIAARTLAGVGAEAVRRHREENGNV